MKKILGIFAFISFFSILPASAQSFTYDKTSVGQYGNSVWPYEIDGNEATQEYLSMRVGEDLVIYYKTLTLCKGEILQTPEWTPYVDLLPNWQLNEITIGGFMEVKGVLKFVANGNRYLHQRDLPFVECK